MSKRRGLIIIGYPGIGKTTLANSNRPYSNIIDLDSTLFNIDDNKIDDWSVIYCKVAVKLASRGFIVLVSSHDEVQQELGYWAANRNDIEIVSITPHLFLKDQWISKLHDRYLKERSDHNKKAWERADKFYVTDIYRLARNNDFSHIYLPDESYDLFRIIMSLRDIYCDDRRQGIVE